MKNSFSLLLVKLMLLAFILTLYSCPPDKQKITIKGNILVTNNCGGTIDSVFIKIKTYHDKEGRRPEIIDSFAVVEGTAKFEKEYEVADDANMGKIISVTGKNGVPICSYAAKTTCTSPKTCKSTPAKTYPPAPLTETLKFDVQCDCQ